MKAEEIKLLPEPAQLVVLELMRLCDEFKALRQEVIKLRRAITEEAE